MGQFLYLAYALGHIEDEYVKDDAFTKLEAIFNDMYKEVEHLDDDPDDDPDDV